MTPKPPIWILTNPRSGSTFLADTLRNIGMDYNEYWHTAKSESLASLVNKQYYNSLNKRLKQNRLENFLNNNSLPAYNKLHYFQYLDLGFDANGLSKIQTHLPGVKFVFLERTNLVQVASSLFLAASLKLSHFPIGGINTQQLPKIELFTPLFYDCYVRAAQSYPSWQGVLKNYPHFYLEFSDMMKNPKEEISNLLKWAEYEVPPSALDKALATKLKSAVEHPQKKEIKKAYEQLHQSPNLSLKLRKLWNHDLLAFRKFVYALRSGKAWG